MPSVPSDARLPLTTPEVRDAEERAELLADRDTLHAVTADLVTARVAVNVVARSLSPRTIARVKSGDVGWVKVPRNAALILIEASEALS